MINKVDLNNMHHLGRNKERKCPPIVVGYHCTMHIVGHKLRPPLAIRCKEMVEREVRGGVVVYSCIYIPTLVKFH